MGKMMTAVITLLVFATSTPIFAQHIKLEKMWSLSEGFIEPESAAYDPISGKLFVTNVNGYTGNGKGFISRMDAFGKNVEEKWITDLDAPTGIVHHDGQIIFADFNRLKIANAETGEIIASHTAPDNNPALNDVAIGPDGIVYVSASRLGVVYKLVENKLVKFIEDKRALKNANGLYIRDNTLITGSEYLHAWRLPDGEHLGLLAPEESPIKNIDGIAGDKLGNLIISLVDDDRFWVIKPGGTYAPIGQSNVNPVDFDLHPNLEFLFTPTIDTTLQNYGVSAFRYTIEK